MSLISTMIRTILYGLLLLWLIMLYYMLFGSNPVSKTEAWETTTSIAHISVAMHPPGHLQSRQAHQKQLHPQAAIAVAYANSNFANLKNYRAAKLHESTKVMAHTTIQMTAAPTIAYRTKRKTEKSENISTLSLLTPWQLGASMQPTYQTLSERKPFEETQALANGPQRAALAGDPAFPDDPGDMPLGTGNWLLLALGMLYAVFKKIVSSKKDLNDSKI